MILIRKAKISDISQLEKLFLTSREKTFTWENPDKFKLSDYMHATDGQTVFVAECNGNIVGHAFLEVLSLHSLKHIAQLNIAVHKGFQTCGIGTKLMEEIIKCAQESESVEKIELNVRASNEQAIYLYKKMGFLEEGRLKRHVKTRNGYIDDILMALHVKGLLPDRKISRTGVYGVAKENGKVLLVIQKSGLFVGLFDLPGGGIEFGEDPIHTLHREFVEETGMNFKSMKQIGNFSAVTCVPSLNGKPGYDFHQIGLIYSVEGLYSLEGNQKDLL